MILYCRLNNSNRRARSELNISSTCITGGVAVQVGVVIQAVTLLYADETKTEMETREPDMGPKAGGTQEPTDNWDIHKLPKARKIKHNISVDLSIHKRHYYLLTC